MKLFTALVTRMLSWLPMWCGRGCAAWLGRLMDVLGTRAASVTRTNLARCFPGLDDPALTRLARGSLMHTGCLLFESGPLAHWPGERLAKLVVSERGREQLTARLQQGRPSDGGVLMLVPHFGNWEFICYVLGSLQFVALYDPPRVDILEQPLRRSRERFGARLLPANAGGLRAAYRQLNAGGLVCLLPDQVPEVRGGTYAPFFGHPALTMTLAHRLIQRTRPAVLLGSASRVPGGFSLAYEPLGEAIYADRAALFAQALNEAIEELVRRDPAQYQWEYKRFKRQPQGYPPVYPKRRSTHKKIL